MVKITSLAITFLLFVVQSSNLSHIVAYGKADKFVASTVKGHNPMKGDLWGYAGGGPSTERPSCFSSISALFRICRTGQQRESILDGLAENPLSFFFIPYFSNPS